MTRRYLALILRTAHATSITVPDLPGCTAIEDTLEAAMAQITRSALKRISQMLEYGRSPPVARSLIQLRGDTVMGTLVDHAEIGIVAVREPSMARAVRRR